MSKKVNKVTVHVPMEMRRVTDVWVPVIGTVPVTGKTTGYAKTYKSKAMCRTAMSSRLGPKSVETMEKAGVLCYVNLMELWDLIDG